jgi:hypothetical protein
MVHAQLMMTLSWWWENGIWLAVLSFWSCKWTFWIASLWYSLVLVLFAFIDIETIMLEYKLIGTSNTTQILKI